MKILIISLPRSGSTSLLERYSGILRLNRFDEPFSKLGNRPYNLEDNSVVKTIISHKPVDFYLEYIRNFDKVILLSRKDLKACAESMAYLSYNMNKGFKHFQNYIWEKTPNYDVTVEYINKCDEDLKTISNIHKIPIKYYEDIFSVNSHNRQRKTKKNIL